MAETREQIGNDPTWWQALLLGGFVALAFLFISAPWQQVLSANIYFTIILHALNAVLLAGLTAQILRVDYHWGIPAGLIYAFHPAVTSMIASPTGHLILLGCACGLLTVLIYDRTMLEDIPFWLVLPTYIASLIFGVGIIFLPTILLALRMLRKRSLSINAWQWLLMTALALIWFALNQTLSITLNLWGIVPTPAQTPEGIWFGWLYCFIQPFQPVRAEWMGFGWYPLIFALVIGAGRWRIWGPLWWCLLMVPAFVPFCSGQADMVLLAAAPAFTYGMAYRALFRRSQGVLRIMLLGMMILALALYIWKQSQGLLS